MAPVVGPLLQLDPTTGAIIGQYGDSITQALAVQPGTGLVYVASGHGIEVFDPTTKKLSHFSDTRVGSLGFASDGTLWAAAWPKDEGNILRFDARGNAEVMLTLNAPIDSIAFGAPGSPLDGLLFVSHDQPAPHATGTELTMIDLATLQTVAVATGGTRGDVIATTPDGRVLLSQSHQVDVLEPLQAPLVAGTNPPADATVALPLGSVSVTFDHDMFLGDATDARSVLDPANYSLTRADGSAVTIQAVAYDQASRTAVLTFDAINAGDYTLHVSTNVLSSDGLGLALAYTTQFTAVTDISSLISLQFSDSRMDRANQTVSYDVTITNTGAHALVLPVVLQLSPEQHFAGVPSGAQGRAADGSFLIDLSTALPGGLLRPGQSITGSTITVQDPGAQRVAFLSSLIGQVPPTAAPVFIAGPVTAAVAGQPYRFQAAAQDPNGEALSYVLCKAPDGMTVDSTSGLLTWTPTASSPSEATVILQVYNVDGAHATLGFTIQVSGAAPRPVFTPLATTIDGTVGQPLQIAVQATSASGRHLVYWADGLPPGALFDPNQQTLTWTPGPQAAGTYPNVRFVVSDGVYQTTAATTLLIAPAVQPPVLVRPQDRTIREGDPLHVQLTASDPQGLPLTFSSAALPGGAVLDPSTGAFDWTPDFTQNGTYDIPFTASNGTLGITQTMHVTVQDVHAAPVFDKLGTPRIEQGSTLRIRAFAFDPENPGFIPQDRLANGTLTPLQGSAPTVSYTVSGLPAGATFDPDTALFTWMPSFTQTGPFTVTFTATSSDGGVTESSTVSMPITVVSTNLPPVVTAIPNQTVNRDATLDVPVQATDPDGDPLVLTVSGLPRFATFTDHGDGTGTLHFAPGVGDLGDYTLTVTASDDGHGNGPTAALSASESFVLSAHSDNEPPRFDFIGDKVAVIGQPLHFTVTAHDLDQDALTITADGLPAGAILTQGTVYGTATVSWTPTATDAGTYPITFRVSDNGNGNPALAANDTQTIRLVVRAGNHAPVLAPVTGPVGAEEQPLVVQLRASDPDADGLTFFASNLPLGATLDPAQGVLRWTPGLFQAGTYKGVVLGVQRRQPVEHPDGDHPGQSHQPAAHSRADAGADGQRGQCAELRPVGQ
jgi:hypothetical protein